MDAKWRLANLDLLALETEANVFVMSFLNEGAQFLVNALFQNIHY